MAEQYRKLLNVPLEHSLVITDTKCEQRKGQDADIYYIDESDENGRVVYHYVVKDSMSIYPPFKKRLTFSSKPA